MRVLFIGIYASSNEIEYLNTKSNKDSQLSVAAIKYSESISNGFIDNLESDNVKNLLLTPIGVFPYSKIFFHSKKNDKTNWYFPLLNIIFIKQFLIALYTLIYTFRWHLFNRGHKNKIIVLGFIYLPFLFGLLPIKLFSKTKIVTFVPDLPEYIFSYTKQESHIKRFLIPFYIFLSKRLTHITDYFVYITENMKTLFPKKPYSVIEGFVSLKDDFNIESIHKEKAILYAGALYTKYGIGNLLMAFNKIETEHELWLCGSGDMVAEITDIAKQNCKIKYLGNLTNKEVVKLEKVARLLINPRPVGDEYTKYSFPSKLLEYMLSGTPVLTTKLECIPDEYNDKMLFISDPSVDGIRESIISCLNFEDEYLRQFGEKARNFVLSEKNSNRQIQVLINNISQIFRN